MDVNHVAAARDDRRIVVAVEKSLWLVDAWPRRTAPESEIVIDDSRSITALTISAMGHLVACGFNDGSILLVDYSRDGLQRTLVNAHGSSVRLLELSDDGSRLASVGDGSDLTVWDCVRRANGLPSFPIAIVSIECMGLRQ